MLTGVITSKFVRLLEMHMYVGVTCKSNITQNIWREAENPIMVFLKRGGSL